MPISLVIFDSSWRLFLFFPIHRICCLYSISESTSHWSHSRLLTVEKENKWFFRLFSISIFFRSIFVSILSVSNSHQYWRHQGVRCGWMMSQYLKGKDDFMWFSSRSALIQDYTRRLSFRILFYSLRVSQRVRQSLIHIHTHSNFAPSDQNVFHPPFMDDNKIEITLVITSMAVVYE